MLDCTHSYTSALVGDPPTYRHAIEDGGG